MDKCHTCNKRKPLTELRRHNRGFRCRSCNTRMCRNYRQTEKGKLALKTAVAKYELKNKHKRRAWDMCFKLGTKPCEVCGEPKTDKHHPDYERPLDVVWLCRLHHKEIHEITV